MAIAIRASVTVSIADESNGTCSWIRRDTRVDVSTSLGTTSEGPGSSRTSSKVRPSSPNLSLGPTYGPTGSSSTPPC